VNVSDVLCSSHNSAREFRSITVLHFSKIVILSSVGLGFLSLGTNDSSLGALWLTHEPRQARLAGIKFFNSSQNVKQSEAGANGFRFPSKRILFFERIVKSG